MKRKISIAFCLACLWTICLLATSGFDSITRIPIALSKYSLLDCLSVVSSALIALMPIAIIVLLILNQKKDITKISATILTIFGILRIAAFILGIVKLFDNLPKYDEVMVMTNRVCNLVISLSTIVLIFLAAKSIKSKQTNKLMRVFNIIIIVATVFYGLLSLITSSYSSIASNTSLISLGINVIIGFSLYMLPKTIYDYENCEFVTKSKLVFAGIVIVCVAVAILIFNVPSQDSGPSCGHQSCAENGPFPCYGKNNTCPNKTDCYQDLYCDKCD